MNTDRNKVINRQQYRRSKGALWRALCLLAWYLAAVQAQARLNLPNSNAEITVDAQTAAQVAKSASALSAGVQRELSAALPQPWRDACPDLVERWGTKAGGSAQWDVRSLYAGGGNVWLAFRCGSRLPEYSGHYDERLAVLRAGSRVLQFLAFDRDSDNDPQLYHVSFSRVLAVSGGRQLPAFRVFLPADNPCCTVSANAGPTAVAISSEERLVIYNDSARPAEALSLVTHRDVTEQDNKAGDTRTIYNVATRVERSAGRNIVVIAADFSEQVNGEVDRKGTIRYAWNPASGKFDQQ